MTMKTQEEIENLLNDATNAWERNATPWNEAVMMTLAWVLDQEETSPLDVEG